MYLPPHDMPALQRARGAVRVGVERRRRASRLADLYQAGCLKAMLPRVHGEVPEVVLINTAGGLTGGDRLEAAFSVGADAQLTVATQTAERAYRSPGGWAEVEVSIRLGGGARLDWLAQETILFDGAALDRRLSVDLAEGAEVLMVEPVVFGRRAMGEVPRRARFRDRWEVRRAGRLVHIEATALEPVAQSLSCRAGLQDAAAVATVLWISDRAADWLDRVRGIAAPAGVLAAASAWEGKLAVRALAADPLALRRYLIEMMTLLRGTPPPRVWTM